MKQTYADPAAHQPSYLRAYPTYGQRIAACDRALAELKTAAIKKI